MEYLNAMLPVVIIGVILLGGFVAILAAKRSRESAQRVDRARLDRRLDRIESEQARLRESTTTSREPNKPSHHTT